MGLGLAVAAVVALQASGTALAPPPATPVIPVVDTYHGVAVVDGYRWLENGNDPKVKAWSAAQTARTRAYLDALKVRAPLATELKRMVKAGSPRYFDLSARGRHVFATYLDPNLQQPQLVMMNAAGDPASRRVVLDPNMMDPSGHTTIDFWTASPDGDLVALSLSRNGSEEGVLHVYRAATGEEVGQPIPRLQYATAGGAVAWWAGGDGFWYTRYPGAEAPADERRFHVQVYSHRLGDDWTLDPVALGSRDGLERISEVFLDNSAARPEVVAMVAKGDGGAFASYLLSEHGQPLKLSDYADQIVSASLGPDGAVYAVSRGDAPNGKVLRLPAPFSVGGLSHAAVLIPETTDGSVRTEGTNATRPALSFSADRVFVRDIIGGPSRVRIFHFDGRPDGEIPLPDVANVDEIDPMVDGSMILGVETYLKPRLYARWRPSTAALSPTALFETRPYDYDDAKVTRLFATSKDGAKVPVNIISRKDVKLDGQNPTLLYGYGGYGENETPYFPGTQTRAWLDAGGVFAIANIRGGGEYGERWHTQGALLNKQNVFDDFAAVAQALVKAGYTTPDHLALLGASNGGLLMGAMITQHPKLARAVVSQVGIYDMLRVELDPNGAYNTTEFGTVKNLAQFRALYAYSPYHHARPGTYYPAVLMTTGDNDDRVNPLNSRKFTAVLQADSASNLPILLTSSATSGHGIGDSLDEQVARSADVLSFLFDQLGMRYSPR